MLPIKLNLFSFEEMNVVLKWVTIEISIFSGLILRLQID